MLLRIAAVLAAFAPQLRRLITHALNPSIAPETTHAVRAQDFTQLDVCPSQQAVRP